jgi:hypothetical protein
VMQLQYEHSAGRKRGRKVPSPQPARSEQPGTSFTVNRQPPLHFVIMSESQIASGSGSVLAC